MFIDQITPVNINNSFVCIIILCNVEFNSYYILFRTTKLY
jgi:hypothetical protein